MGFAAKQRFLLLSYWRKISFFAKKLSQNTKKVKKTYVFKAYAPVHLQMVIPQMIPQITQIIPQNWGNIKNPSKTKIIVVSLSNTTANMTDGGPITPWC